MVKMRSAVLVVLATAGCLIGFAPDARGDIAKTGAAVGNAGEAKPGRLWRPDDQMRFLWMTVDPILPDLVRQGFNTIITSTGSAYDLEKDAPVSDLGKFCEKRKKRLDFIQSLGLTLFEQPPYAHNSAMDERFVRVNRDGSLAKHKRNPDAANPEYQAIIRRAYETEAKTIAGHPAVFGLQTSSEVHDRSQISLTAKTAADWKAYSGMDIPEYADKGDWPRVPPYWKLLVDKGQMDPSRIIPDDYPLLRFFRWVWRHGDGWNDYQRIAGEAYNGAAARRVVTQYDPLLRTPASRTSFPDVDYLNHWEYPVPDPYSVCYIVSEEQSRVRGKRHSLMTMILAIVYRSAVAPKDEHPANEPAWTKEFPNTNYPTVPADILQEAIWSAFARKTDAIGFHGWCALYDGMIINLRHDLNRYQCADPTAIKTIGRLFNEVGIPLGPLFKALPERQMEVAVLESDAAQFFNNTLWSSSLRGTKTDIGNLAVMGNLNPQTLLEEEIAASGIPASVKVLLMPQCDVLTESGVRAVRAFQSRGGRIFADERLVPSIHPDGALKTVEAAWKEKEFDHDDGVADPAKDASLRMRFIYEAAAKLKAAAGVVPFADTDTPSIFTWTRSCGSADYVFAINDKRTFGPYMGPWKRLCDKGEPNSGTVVVNRRAGAVYDLVRHVSVPFSVKDGKTRINVKYETNDGRLFMVAAAPLKALDASRDAGRLIVASPDLDVMIPIKVEVGKDEVFYGVVANGHYETSVNPSKDVRVVNLATGSAFSAVEEKKRPLVGLSGRAASTLDRIDQFNARAGSDRLIEMSAWRGERVHAQVVVWSDLDEKSLELASGGFVSRDGSRIAADRVVGRFVRTVNTKFRRSSAECVTVGDCLDPNAVDWPKERFPGVWPKERFRAVWWTVDVPADAKAGKYSGEVAVRGASGEVRFPVALTILDRQLPPAKDRRFFLDLWQHPWCVARHYGVKPFSSEHYRHLEPLYRELAAAGQKSVDATITDLPWGEGYSSEEGEIHTMVKSFRRADGSWRYDYSDLDSYVEFARRCGLGPQIHLYTIAKIGDNHVFYYIDEATGERRSEELYEGTPEYEKFLAPLLKSLVVHLRGKGWLDDSYIAIDEVAPERLLPARQFLKRVAPELKFALASNVDPLRYRELSDDTDVMSQLLWTGHGISTFFEDDFAEFMARRRERGQFTTFYVCTQPQKPNTWLESPLVETAWLGLYAAAKHFDGFLRWATFLWGREPFDEPRLDRFPAGENFLLYPGGLASVRWELLRDSIEDWEKIRILREKGDASAALEKALGRIDYFAVNADGEAATRANVEAVWHELNDPSP